MSTKKKTKGKKKTKRPERPFDPKQVREQLLLYGLGEDTSRGQRLRVVMEKVELEWTDLTAEDLYRKVGTLAGVKEAPAPERKPPEVPPETELLLMCGVSDEKMDALFDEMRRAGLAIDHKASLTEHNRKWTLMDLLEEIEGEHQMVQAYMELNRLANSAMGVINASKGDPEGIVALRNGVAAAVSVMNQEEPEEARLKEAARALKEQYLKVTGLTEITGKAILDPKKQENGLWSLSVLVKDAPDLAYQYSWNTGETGPELTDLPAEELITRVVTIRSEQGWGSLQAQLQVPEKPEVTVREELDRLRIEWKPLHSSINLPDVEHYCVEVFTEEGSLSGAMRFGPEEIIAELDELEEDCEYTVKVWAENIAGQSDKTVVRIKRGA